MIGQREHRYDQDAFYEKSWFLALMIAIVVLLGVAVWYVTSHPEQVARWVNPSETTRVQPVKPTVH